MIVFINFSLFKIMNDNELIECDVQVAKRKYGSILLTPPPRITENLTPPPTRRSGIVSDWVKFSRTWVKTLRGLSFRMSIMVCAGGGGGVESVRGELAEKIWRYCITDENQARDPKFLARVGSHDGYDMVWSWWFILAMVIMASSSWNLAWSCHGRYGK